MRGDIPSGTVTFLFTDIEGSTKLLHELGPAGYADALAEHRRVLREAFAAHAGVEVDTQGDAFFVAFSSAPDAAAAARDAQEKLAAGAVKVRMGLHTGTPHRTGEGYVGEDVNLGARIAASGHGGQVVLSKATRELIDAGLRDLGEHRVKDFDEPVWIFQLGDEAFPPLKTISNTNLPRPASSFVGREREVGEVEALLRDGARLVTLTGPGGSGKTRLSIEAAAELIGEFRNGVFWVGLATVHDADLVVPTVAETIGAQEELTAHIGEREMLLLLDNFEQVVDVAPELATLVEACPNLKLLVTSRQLLRVRGEVEYEVLPLADPDAVELFCLRSGLSPSSAIEELCRRLDNMPLALELAAARTKALSAEQILERLSERLDLFKGGRDAEPRQATLRATIEWSYDLLDPAEQRLFARLGVFAGGCTLESAQAVCGADLDTLQSLVEKSLLRHTAERFWMLETIREYGLERLEASGEGEAMRRRLAEHLLGISQAAGFAHESEDEERYDLIQPELANIRATLQWALEADPELGLRLAVVLEQLWVVTSPFEARRWLGQFLERGPYPDDLQARLLRVYGGVIWIVGDFDEGNRYHEEAAEMFRRLGDERGVALMLPRLAVDANKRGDREKARALCEEALTSHRARGFEKGEAEALLILGYVEFEEGRLEEALDLSDRAAVLAEKVGWVWWQVNALGHAAECALRLGRPHDARPRAVGALSLAHAIGERQWIIYGLVLLASVAAETGEAERAGQLWGAVEAEAERGRVGQWELERDEYEQRVFTASGPDFERGLATGKSLALDEAVEYALGSLD